MNRTADALFTGIGVATVISTIEWFHFMWSIRPVVVKGTDGRWRAQRGIR